MNVDLKTTGNIQVYDLQTRFATTSGAPGMKALCQAAITNDGRIDKESLMMEYNLSESAVRNLFSSGISCGVWDSDGVLTDDGYNPLFPNWGSQKELEFLYTSFNSKPLTKEKYNSIVSDIELKEMKFLLSKEV